MGISDRFMKEKAVYWPPSGFGADGRPTHGTAEEISVKWMEGLKSIRDTTGTIHEVDTVALVSKDLKVDGFLWLGKLADVPNASDPLDSANTNVGKIKVFNKVQEVSSDDYVRQVAL